VQGGYVSCGSNGVWRVQDCLAVSRAFGDADLKRWVIPEPEIRRLPITAGCEFLVLASDGLWNKVSNQEAVDAVSRSSAGRDSTGCCKELVDMARCRGSRDDITVMVVDLKRFTI
jgi:protein phosphatase 1L